MASFTETIKFGSTIYRLEFAPAGGVFVNLNIKFATTDSMPADPSDWKSCFTDRHIDLRKNQNIEKIRCKMKLPPDQSFLIIGVIEKFEQSIATSAAVEQKERSRFKIYIRGKLMPESAAITIEGDTPLAAISNALAADIATLPDEALIIVPDDMEQIAFLDVDYHEFPLDQRPDERDLDAMMNSILPRGIYGFASHGRGLKMIFTRQEALSAKVLADCAASYIHLIDPRCDTEVLNTCRHPAMPRGEQKCGPVREMVSDATIAIIGVFNRFACPPDIAERFRTESGWQLGQRYGHERCPIDPTHISGSPNPIIALEHGVYCHSCNGRHGDGYRSWGQLAGLVTEDKNPIYEAARHRAHWDHVKYLFKELKIDS